MPDWYDIFDIWDQVQEEFKYYSLETRAEYLSEIQNVLNHPNPEELLGCEILPFIEYATSGYWLDSQTEEGARDFLIRISSWLK